MASFTTYILILKWDSKMLETRYCDAL